MPLAPRLDECCLCGLLTRLACACVCVRACVCLFVCACVLRPQVWNAVNNLLDDYSHGVVHDFDKLTGNATEKAPEENVGEGDAYQIEALKLHLKVCCRLCPWMDA